MVFLTFGTGMGSGLILDGRLYAGSLGLAGEVGHLRLAPDGPLGHGKAGSFEGFCSGGGIARMAQAAAHDAWAGGGSVGYCTPETIEALSAQSVAARARSGDPDARRIIELSAEQLGRGLAVLVDILNPELIVIGGIYMRNLDLFEDAVMRVLRAEALAASAEACRVAPAALGERIGDCAALVAAIGEEVR
jgi:glucokinase